MWQKDLRELPKMSNLDPDVCFILKLLRRTFPNSHLKVAKKKDFSHCTEAAHLMDYKFCWLLTYSKVGDWILKMLGFPRS